jgi:hypothetical protein
MSTHAIPEPVDLVPVTQLPAKKKTPLAEAASLLTELCERIDNGENLDHALMAAFNETKLDLAEAVDRRIAFDHWCKGAIEAARQARNDWDERKKLLEALLERFKENTKAIIEANPDLPYAGKLGRLALQKNPPSVQYAFGTKDVTPDLIDYLGIPREYVRVTYEIDTAKVKADLLAGKEITWAALKTDGCHLRVRK